MVFSSEIRKVISDYLSEKNADKFVSNFSVLSYNIHKNGNLEAVRLADEVESKLADRRGGFVSESVLLENLRDLIKPSANTYATVAVVFVQAGSTNQPAVVENPFQGSVGFSDTSLAGVRGLITVAR